MSIYQWGVHGDYTGHGEVTNVEANNNSGGRGAGKPVRHKIPLGILIFLVYHCNELMPVAVRSSLWGIVS